MFLIDFQISFTSRLGSKRVMKRRSHHTSNKSLQYLVKCKCQGPADNLQKMSPLTYYLFCIVQRKEVARKEVLKIELLWLHDTSLYIHTPQACRTVATVIPSAISSSSLKSTLVIITFNIACETPLISIVSCTHLTHYSNVLFREVVK